MEESEYLQVPLTIAILPGIGLFHVRGHVWECFSCFSPSFIPGTGQVDGEILESLWSVLNEISPSTQNATLAGRTETLDDHMEIPTSKKCLILVSVLVCTTQKSLTQGHSGYHWLPI